LPYYWLALQGPESLLRRCKWTPARIPANKEQSFGSEDTLWVSSQNRQPEKIAYLAFAGMTTLPQQISSSNLKMYVNEVERPGKVSIHLYNQADMGIITLGQDQPEYDPEALITLDIQEPGWPDQGWQLPS
jgi:hypothetical protein